VDAPRVPLCTECFCKLGALYPVNKAGENTGTENVFTGGGRGIYTGGQVHRLY